MDLRKEYYPCLDRWERETRFYHVGFIWIGASCPARRHSGIRVVVFLFNHPLYIGIVFLTANHKDAYVTLVPLDRFPGHLRKEGDSRIQVVTETLEKAYDDLGGVRSKRKLSKE